MKTGIHPGYHPVVFRDRSGALTFLTRSTATEKTVAWEDGNVYPVVDVDVTSASHRSGPGPHARWTTRGRVERFNRRYSRPANDVGER